VEPPAGNFSVIAVCGMSGVILGPPNHHEYQRNIARLHRERFSDMPIERYKSRIRMESGAEILEKWKEQVSCVRQYRVRSSDQPSSLLPPAPPLEVEVPAASETPAESPEPAEEMREAETLPDDLAAEANPPTEATSAEETEKVPSDEIESGEETPDLHKETAPEDKGPVLKSIEEVARHFRQHFAEDTVIETAIAVVPGTVAGRQLSPGLLAHLKRETDKLRHGFPLPLIQSLCHSFEQRGLKFFKRGKKSLHVSAVRPKSIDDSATFTEQIQRIVGFVTATARPTVAGLLEALAPGFRMPQEPLPEEHSDLSDEVKSILGDLRWLTSEGYVLEFPDTSLAIGRPKQETAPSPASEKPKKEKKEKRDRAPRPETAVAPTPEGATAPPADSPLEEAMDDLPPDALVTLSGEENDPDDPHELPDSVNPVETF